MLDARTATCLVRATALRKATPGHTRVVRQPGTVISPNNPNLRVVRNGNSVAVYDQGGRLTGYGTRRGNVLKFYNASGRHVRTGVFGRNGAAVYDTRGRLLSSTSDVRDAR
jgi:hypothetical protein